MKNNRSTCDVLFVLILLFTFNTVAFALTGSGTETNPYLIEDLADFDKFADPNNASVYWVSGVYTRLDCDQNLAGRMYTTAVIAPDFPDITDWNFDGISFSGFFDGNYEICPNNKRVIACRRKLGRRLGQLKDWIYIVPMNYDL